MKMMLILLMIFFYRISQEITLLCFLWCAIKRFYEVFIKQNAHTDIKQTNKAIIGNKVTENSLRIPFIVIHDFITGNAIY